MKLQLAARQCRHWHDSHVDAPKADTPICSSWLIEKMPPDSANEDACTMRNDGCQQPSFRKATFFLTSQVFPDTEGNALKRKKGYSVH